MFDLHRRYEKVHRLEKDECKGLLNGTVYVFEKLDGANTSVWLDSNKNLCMGSRNLQIARGDETFDSFRGFVDYVRNYEPILALLKERPYLRLFGEWLVKHTINYPSQHKNIFYVFDVWDEILSTYMHYEDFAPLLEAYRIPFIRPFVVFNNPTIEQVKEYIGKTNYGASPCGEGVVLKNYSFVNQFGENVYGKLVSKDFQEVFSLVWTNSKKDSVESRITAQYCTPARVKKIVQKHGLKEMKDIPKLFGLIYHDIITEDGWDIIKRYKNPVIDYKQLLNNIQKVSKNYFINILQEGVE